MMSSKSPKSSSRNTSKLLAAAVEALESRRLLAVVPVTSFADSGEGSLRDAITMAQDGDTIDLGQMIGTITLDTQLTIDKTLTLIGPGKDALTISGNHATRLFDVQTSEIFMLSDVTLDGGMADNGGALHIDGTGIIDRVAFTNNTATQRGGAVYGQMAAVRMNDCSFTGNSARPDNFDAMGGALFAEDGDLTVTGCTFADNTAVGASGFGGGSAYGGAVAMWGALAANFTNCTFIGNTASGGTTQDYLGFENSAFGGAMVVATTGSLALTNCTIYGNSATAGFSFNGDQSVGGGMMILANAPITLKNTIVAGNTAASGNDLGNGAYATSLGNNLIGDGFQTAFVNGVNGDLVGATDSPLDPKLDVLASNGGSTPTLALLPDSPAINNGTSDGAPETDQRGSSRHDAVDIGAYEFIPPNSEPFFTSTFPTTAESGTEFKYDITAADADAGDALTITANPLPAWLTLVDNKDGTAVLSGPPGVADAGELNVNLFVSDGHAIVAQPFTVTVTAVNHAPQFTSTPVATVAANVSYTYNIAAADLDGDTIAFQAGTLPAWLSLLDHADGTATLTGTPSSSDIGNVDIAISINDGTSWATQQFTLGVAAAAPSGGEVNPLPPVFVG